MLIKRLQPQLVGNLHAFIVNMPQQNGSISRFIGLNDPNTPTLLSDDRLDPDAFPALAKQAAALNDIRQAYPDALLAVELQERDQDRFFLERAREYVELNDQVDTSASLLTDLATFLSTFQHDLSAVSGHISELQGRSKSIEARLASRRAVEKALDPFLKEIVLQPKLIDLVLETDVGLDWVEPIKDLSLKILAIRSGPRVAARKNLDEAAEALRVKASQKIISHFLSLLQPFGTSVASPLPDLHTQCLLPLKPLFDFLWQHSPRQAHEFQKAYTSTVRWYYETAFRRYVRSLDKVRLKSITKHELIGNVTMGSAASLALLEKKKHHATRPDSEPAPSTSALDQSRIAGPEPISASSSTSASFRATPETLFRSLSVVLMSNASTEYTFLSSFFAQHSSLPNLYSSTSLTNLNPNQSVTSLFSPHISSSSVREFNTTVDDRTETMSQGGGSETTTQNGNATTLDIDSGTKRIKEREKEERAEKLRKAVLDGIWKGVMDPALEYCRNFVTTLLDPLNLPTPTSHLSMIRLNESIYQLLITGSHCPSIESHLTSLRLSLWPSFSRIMNSHIDSLHKLQLASEAGSGVFGKSIKDSQVLLVVMKYGVLFGELVALSEDQDDEMVFASVLRLRHELDKLLITQASKITDPSKQKQFLNAHYQELLQALSAGLSTHARSQTEVAHYRELVRKLG